MTKLRCARCRRSVRVYSNVRHSLEIFKLPRLIFNYGPLERNSMGNFGWKRHFFLLKNHRTPSPRDTRGVQQHFDEERECVQKATPCSSTLVQRGWRGWPDEIETDRAEISRARAARQKYNNHTSRYMARIMGSPRGQRNTSIGREGLSAGRESTRE